MKGNMVNKVRTHARSLSSGLFICLALALSGVALGASPPVGQWFGQVMVGTRPMAVTLKLTGSRDHIDGVLLAGSPRQCRVHLVYDFSGTKDTWKFNVDDPNGGICDGFVDDQLTLRETGKDTFTFDVGGLQGHLAAADAYHPLDLNGDWVALRGADGTGPALSVRLQASIPSGRESKWRYAANRSCTLEAEYAGAIGRTEYFSFSHSNGGFCDRFADGYVKLTRRNDGDLDYQMDGAGKSDATENGVLQQATK